MRDDEKPERWELSDALARLAAETRVPPAESERHATLMAAFDRAHAPTPNAQVRTPRDSRFAAYVWLGGLAAAAVLLIAVGIRPAGPARPGPPDGGSVARGAATNTRGGGTQPDGANDFIPWPGASALPPLESGQLVRMQLPVTMLPSLGVAPPAARVTAVTADVVVGQDGLARAVRLVAD